MPAIVEHGTLPADLGIGDFTFGDQPDDVSSPNLEWLEMREKWEMLHDLLGGTRVMRAAGMKWLPKEPKEKIQSYRNRLARSFLFNGLKKGVKDLVSKPFSRPVNLVGTLPSELLEMSEDVDRCGKDITAFGRQMFKAACTYGLTHLLVDFPALKNGATLADQRRVGARPTFVHVKPTNLFAWKYREVGGVPKLTEIRIYETRNEDAGDFKQTIEHYIRVYTEKGWSLHKRYKNKDNGKWQWSVEASGTHTFGEVPLRTLYLDQTGFMTADPPLEDLAWLNIAHWQSSSDQRNILRMTRCGILFAKGFAETKEMDDIVIGPNNTVKTTSKDADLKFVEHNGNAIKSGQDDINKLEEQMEALGMQPFIQRTADSTATGKVLDSNRSDSDIQAWIRACEMILQDGFKLAAQWIKKKLPDDFRVDIYNDFSVGMRGAMDLNSLLEMRKPDQLAITRRTYLQEMRRRGVLSDHVDVEAEDNGVKKEIAANRRREAKLAKQTSRKLDTQADGRGRPVKRPVRDRIKPIPSVKTGNNEVRN